MRVFTVFPALVATLVLTISPASAQRVADETTRRQALELYRTGQEFMSSERYDKAVEAFTAAVEKDPLLTVAHYQLGQAHMALKRPASAVQAYQGCLQAMETLHHLEESNKFEVDRQRQEAIREMRTEMTSTSLKVDPLKRVVVQQRINELEQERTAYSGAFRPPAFVLLALGSAYFRNGNLAEAEQQWKAAVEANNKYGEAHNNLAALYAMSGRKKEAEIAVREAEKAGFRVNPQLKEDIRKLAASQE
jgi:tetratricopeptide (TPR) repeat protein